MTVQETMPAYTRRHWAKSDRGDHGRIHLLEHHLADVGACFEALLVQPTIRQRLARTADLANLDDATVARLCVFAALHDIGKVNVGFQTQIWRRRRFAGRAAACILSTGWPHQGYGSGAGQQWRHRNLRLVFRRPGL